MTVLRSVTDARGVVTLSLDRPDARNALDDALIRELGEAARAIPADARCVVLRGEGETFCSGGDVRWMHRAASLSESENEADVAALAATLADFDAIPVPVIVRAHGAAFGGGAGLVAIADMAIAARGTLFAFSEARLGLVPATISPYVIRRIGTARASGLFTTSRHFDADRALAYGLVDEVVESAALDDAVAAAIHAVCEGGPRAVREAKRLVREIPSLSPVDARAFAVDLLARLRVGEEGQEGLSAFMEKRKPRW